VVERVSYSAMASLPPKQDLEGLPTDHPVRPSPFLGHRRGFAATVAISRYEPPRVTNEEEECDAEAPPRNPNPFGDEMYPASAASSVRSMNLKTSRPICSESGDSETPNVETSKKPVPVKPFGVSQPYRGNWARVRNYTGHATLPEGSSTIDDILRQYKNSEGASTNSEFHPNTQSRNVSYMTDGSGLFSDSHDVSQPTAGMVLDRLMVNRVDILHMLGRLAKLACLDP
jgi:hypothetical protein